MHTNTPTVQLTLSVKKKAVMAAGLIAGAYLIGPVIAGMVGYPLAQGPRAYPAQLHASLYAIGAIMTGRPGGKSATMLERPLYYGGKIYLKRSFYERLPEERRADYLNQYPLRPVDETERKMLDLDN
jgi:hypothetical protein